MLHKIPADYSYIDTTLYSLWQTLEANRTFQDPNLDKFFTLSWKFIQDSGGKTYPFYTDPWQNLHDTAFHSAYTLGRMYYYNQALPESLHHANQETIQWMTSLSRKEYTFEDFLYTKFSHIYTNSQASVEENLKIIIQYIMQNEKYIETPAGMTYGIMALTTLPGYSRYVLYNTQPFCQTKTFDLSRYEYFLLRLTLLWHAKLCCKDVECYVKNVYKNQYDIINSTFNNIYRHESVYHTTLDTLGKTPRVMVKIPKKNVTSQWVFCVDARSFTVHEYLRRNNHATYGYSGAFGLMWSRKNQTHTIEHHCPSFVEPEFFIDNPTMPQDCIPLDKQCTLAINMLKNLGITENFSPILVVCGHYSSQDALLHLTQCAACGGYSGQDSAEIMANILNSPSVRAKLHKEHNIDIPVTTYVMAAVHDTYQQHLQFSSHSVKCLPKHLHTTFLSLKKDTDAYESFYKNTHISKNIEVGLKHHAAFVIGSCFPNLPEGTSSFFWFYNAVKDQDNTKLHFILMASLRLIQNINASYFHAVCDDLNLPDQDTYKYQDMDHTFPSDLAEDFIPRRLTVIIEAQQSMIHLVLKKSKILQDLVNNQWIHLVSMEEAKELYHFRHIRDV